MTDPAQNRPDPESKGPPTPDGKRPQGGPDGKPGASPQRPQGRAPLIIAAVLLGLIAVFVLSASGGGKAITLAEFKTAYTDGDIKRDSVVIMTNEVRAVEQRPGQSDRRVRIRMNEATREGIAEEVRAVTGDRARNESPSLWLPLLVNLIPFIILLVLIFWVISRVARAASGGSGMLGNFGKSKHRTMTKEMTGVTFKDVAGVEEAKDEVGEIVEFLRNPRKFTKLGGRIPRGVLLTGPPGCGKTLLAKAIAGEADVPFFSISGSDFVEMFVGVGASRVRDLFKQAKESAPCIVFLDEIDAVGRKRGGGFNSGGNDEREQTLNAILVEMDGFTPSDGVIVIAATNRPDVLDQALVRPGRFDRQIPVTLPDVKGRMEILRVHARKVKTGPDVDLEKLAKITPMFSGADLAALINEAAIAATMQNKDFIEMDDLEEARDKVRFGRARKSRVREKDENKLTAYHEAGHAVLQMLLDDSDPLHKVTIIPRGQMGGATFSLPEKDRMGVSLKWLRATMIMACGGRIAEERATNDVSSGAVGDISQVTDMARGMVLEWGMSEKLGFVRDSTNASGFTAEREYSERTAEIIDDEVRRITGEAFKEAERLIGEHWDETVRIAEALLKYETLSREDVEQLMAGQALDKPTVSDLLAKVASKESPKTEPEPEAADPDPELPPGVSPSPA